MRGKKICFISEGLFILVIVFFHFLNLQFGAFLEMGIDGGCDGAIRLMSCPKADDFTANSTFLRACNKDMSKVVQVVAGENFLKIVRQRS